MTAGKIVESLLRAAIDRPGKALIVSLPYPPESVRASEDPEFLPVVFHHD
jgi:hypothetical protein